MRKLALWQKIALSLAILMIGHGIALKIREHTAQKPLSAPTIYDDAGLFSLKQQAALESYHRALLHEYDIDYRVLTTRSGTIDINLQANKEFRDKKAGKLSKSGRGLLLLIDAEQNEVRLEVSATLEPVYTDAFVSYLQHRQMIPFFRTGRITDGILATTELITTRAQDAEAGSEFVPPPSPSMAQASIGGGAANSAQIGKGTDRNFENAPDVKMQNGGPSDVLAAYLAAREQRNANPSLSIYSRSTRTMLKKWTVTPAQMDNEAREIKRCGAGETLAGSSHAVIRFAPKLRQCSPYFFIFEDGAWRLDLTMMQKAIRFNHRNEWHFDRSWPPAQEPYGFAFRDWRFDKYGFPHPPK